MVFVVWSEGLWTLLCSGEESLCEGRFAWATMVLFMERLDKQSMASLCSTLFCSALCACCLNFRVACAYRTTCFFFLVFGQSAYRTFNVDKIKRGWKYLQRSYQVCNIPRYRNRYSQRYATLLNMWYVRDILSWYVTVHLNKSINIILA